VCISGSIKTAARSVRLVVQHRVALAHHRSAGNYGNASQSSYWAQPNVTMSPSGARILFQSDWGDAMIDTYVLELTSYEA